MAKITKEKATTMSLPVFRKVQDLCSLMVDVQNGMQKQYKHSIGDRMLSTCLDMLRRIFTINRTDGVSDERLSEMRAFTDDFDYLRVLLRISEEKRLLTLKQQASIALLTENINAQMVGWKNKTEARHNNAARSEP